MKAEDLKKIAKSYFDNDKERVAMFATASGHFFYSKENRDTFIRKSEKTEEPVDFTREDFIYKKAAPDQNKTVKTQNKK